MGLEVGKKLRRLIAVTAKTYTLRLVIFCVVAGYAAAKKAFRFSWAWHPRSCVREGL